MTTPTVDERPVTHAMEPIGVLAPDGSLQPGAQVEEPAELVLEMYRWMVFGRILDTRLFNLQRQGRLTTYAPGEGQEAAQVGSALALHTTDWLLGTYRDNLAYIVHGLPAEHVALFFRGHPKAGMIPPGVNVLPQQIGIGEHIPHAVGVAWGMKLRQAPTIAMALFGDGATSEGAFHEAANFAGVFKAPVVLVCQNNGWAISVPRSRQTASETFAQKAVAYGMPGVLVDGNDVLAVYRQVRAAVQRARRGEGPTLIEAVTYRVGPHTTADDPTRYSQPEIRADWKTTRDPLIRLRAYLERTEQWDESRQAQLEEQTREQVAAIVTNALQEPAPAPETLFDHIYANSSPQLDAQRRELQAELEREGEHGHG